MTIIQHAVWLYHRFPLSYRDVQELLHQRGIIVSHETLREWCIKFGPLFAEDLRHREPVGAPGGISTRCGYCRPIQNLSLFSSKYRWISCGKAVV